MNAADVYRLVARVPAGRVVTYGGLARALGSPRGARAVGRILRANPAPLKIPCHRVVCSDGRLGGYFGSDPRRIREKACLLKQEGVVLDEKDFPGRVFSLKDFLFDDFRALR